MTKTVKMPYISLSEGKIKELIKDFDGNKSAVMAALNMRNSQVARDIRRTAIEKYNAAIVLREIDLV